MAVTERHSLLVRQHEVYFPLLNDPSLLVGHVLEVFGPEGREPILSAHGREAAYALLMRRCLKWRAICDANGLSALLQPEPIDYDSMTDEELADGVSVMLSILDDSEKLLAYLSTVFGPMAPGMLAITDQRDWNVLDHLFQGRLLNQTASIPIDPEIAPDVQMTAELTPATAPADQAAPLELTGPVIAGLLVLGAGVGAGGCIALAALARLLTTPAGARTIGTLAPAALGGLTRQIFTGPNGGRYVITRTGTKSYCVP